MRVGIPKEIVPDEKRIALVPEAAGTLVKAGMELLVEAGLAKAPFSRTAPMRRSGPLSCPMLAPYWRTRTWFSRYRSPSRTRPWDSMRWI